MALCSGPILLAVAASAGRNDDHHYPTPTPIASSEGSVVMAPEASTELSYDSPTEIYPETPAPTIGDTPEPYADATPGPFYDVTSAPTDYYVETTDEGGMEEIPSATMGSGGGTTDEEIEAAPMNNPADGASCSIYDEDVSVGCHTSCACRAFNFSCFHDLKYLFASVGIYFPSCHMSVFFRFSYLIVVINEVPRLSPADEDLE